MARKRKGIPALAEALGTIATQSAGLETKADAVLAIIRVTGIADLPAFDSAVKVAYAENGWNTERGRPTGKVKRGIVPPTVKQYISQVRGAYKLKLDPGKYDTFHALRVALKAERAKQQPAADVDPVMAGAKIVQPDTLTGAPFHDLMALYAEMDAAKQNQLVAAVEGLVKRFRSAAPALKVVEEFRKAA